VNGALDTLWLATGESDEDATNVSGDRCYRAGVALVMVGSIAQAGVGGSMSALKPGDFEVISSEAGCFD
jgi:hypothetical protein